MRPCEKDQQQQASTKKMAAFRFAAWLTAAMALP
jgi:hypothetical protein